MRLHGTSASQGKRAVSGRRELQGRPTAVQYSHADFHARATTTWLVNSEGTIVRKAATEYEEGFGTGAQAADGMRLDRSYGTSGVVLNDLDSPEVFEKHAVQLIASLAELRKAPLVEEEYHGPVLLSSDASADTLRALIASGVAATRPKLGTEARTNGPFASSFHAPPCFLRRWTWSMIPDEELQGKQLLGAYTIDDDGVRPKKST